LRPKVEQKASACDKLEIDDPASVDRVRFSNCHESDVMKKWVYLTVVIATILVLVKALNPRNHVVAGDSSGFMSPVSPLTSQR
jgi:hypothetical protein